MNLRLRRDAHMCADFSNVRAMTGCGGDHFDFLACLKGMGFDSVQQANVYEGSTMLYEIINLQDTHYQTDGCFDPWMSAGKYFKGHDASIPCRCRTEGSSWGWQDWGSPLNCNG